MKNCYTVFMKSIPPSPIRQFVIFLLIFALAVFLIWVIYLLRDLIGLFLVSCFFALLLSPFVMRLKRWKIPDVIGILMTFFGAFLIVGLFIVSIIPVFIGLAEDSKVYVIRTVSSLELQAQQGFPIIDSLPFHLGKVVRNGVNIEEIQHFIADENRTQFVLNGLVDNIDNIKSFAQK